MAKTTNPLEAAAWLYGLPLTRAQALAFSAIEADVATVDQVELFKAWVMAMTLVHGTWVPDTLSSFLNRNVSPT